MQEFKAEKVQLQTSIETATSQLQQKEEAFAALKVKVIPQGPQFGVHILVYQNSV